MHGLFILSRFPEKIMPERSKMWYHKDWYLENDSFAILMLLVSAGSCMVC